jgi:transposase
MQFRELTDDRQWDLIRPSSLPRPAYTGRPRADDGMTVNGILYVLMSGCRYWMDEWMDEYAIQIWFTQNSLKGAS